MGDRSATTQTESGVIGCTEARAAQFFDLLDRLENDDDVELIHDVRVASRRLGEALGVLGSDATAEGLPRFRAWLREIRGLLAPVRDADVNRQVLVDLVGGEEKLASIPAGVGFAEMLGRRRRYHLIDARFQLQADVVAERREELARILAEAVNRAGSAATLETALDRRLRRRVGRRRRAFRQSARRAARSGRPRRLHATRIAGKKIRYALELAHDAQVLNAKGEVKWLRRIQDALGDLNDATVLDRRMKVFAEQADPERLAGMGKIASRIKRRQRRLIKRFVGDWPGVRRRLRRAKARRTPGPNPSA